MFSVCKFVLLVDLYFYRLCGDCIRPEMSDNLKSVLCTSSLLLCLSDFSHSHSVCVCSSSPLNTVVSLAPALGLRPEQILRVEVQW